MIDPFRRLLGLLSDSAHLDDINIYERRNVADCGSAYAEQMRELTQFGFTIHGGASSMSVETNFPPPQVSRDAQGGEEDFRIRDQMKRVNSLAPGTKQHRVATEVLLLLQDSAHVMAEAKTMLREAKQSTANRRTSHPTKRL